MKIAHCIFTMRTGGAQVLVTDLLNEFCLEHEVSLVIVNDQWNDLMLGKLDKRVKVYFINRKEGSKNPLFLFKLNAVLRRIKPDVIHCHEDKMIKLLLPGFRTVFTIHDIHTEINQIRKYSAAIAISGAVAADVFERIQLLPPVIHNGIAMDDFRRRQDYTLGTGRIRLVQLSRLIHEKKGQDIIIQALALLIRERGIPGIELDFIGAGASQEYLESMVSSMGLQDHVKFLSERDRNWIQQNLCTYHILVQPSRFEGFGLTVVEGIAAGLPVVASNIEGPAEIMHKVDRHFLFEKENIGACADSVQIVIELYRQNAIAKVMDSTYPIISRDYSIKSTAANYLGVYNKVK